MRKRKILKQYTGRLNTAQAAEGIQTAIRNSRSLLADAKLLLENERWQRAAALAILAIEEAGKVSILRGLLLTRKEEELKDEWRSYRSHTSKNVTYILPELVAKGARKLEHLRSIFDESSEHGQVLDSIKQISFYSDALGDCHWSAPKRSLNLN